MSNQPFASGRCVAACNISSDMRHDIISSLTVEWATVEHLFLMVTSAPMVKEAVIRSAFGDGRRQICNSANYRWANAEKSVRLYQRLMSWQRSRRGLHEQPMPPSMPPLQHFRRRMGRRQRRYTFIIMAYPLYHAIPAWSRDSNKLPPGGSTPALNTGFAWLPSFIFRKINASIEFSRALSPSYFASHARKNPSINIVAHVVVRQTIKLFDTVLKEITPTAENENISFVFHLNMVTIYAGHNMSMVLAGILRHVMGMKMLWAINAHMLRNSPIFSASTTSGWKWCIAEQIKMNDPATLKCFCMSLVDKLSEDVARLAWAEIGQKMCHWR